MTFEKGKKYYDTRGRRWKIIDWTLVGNRYRVAIVRRWFRMELAIQNDPDSAYLITERHP